MPILFLVIYTVICYNKDVKIRKKIKVLYRKKEEKEYEMEQIKQ